MLYPICPTCGALLCNIQIPYENDLASLCEKYNVDIELLSSGQIDNDEFNKEKLKLVDKYTDRDRYCCKMRLTNYVPLAKIMAR